MTVGELINELQRLNADMPVRIGNMYGLRVPYIRKYSFRDGVDWDREELLNDGDAFFEL